MTMRLPQVIFVYQTLIDEGFPKEEVRHAVDRAVGQGAVTTRTAYDLAKADLYRAVVVDNSASEA